MKITKAKRACLYLAGGLLLSLSLACTPEKTVERTDFLEVGSAAYRLPSPSTELTIPMAATADWTAESDAPQWLHVQPSGGAGSISMSNLTITVDENNSGAERTGMVTVRSGKAVRQIDVWQDQKVAPWAVVKASSGAYETSSPYVMYERDGALVAKDVPLMAGSSFVLMYNEDWLQPSLCDEERILGGPGLVGPNLRIPVGDESFVVSEGANYDIYLAQDLGSICLMRAGTDPAEAEAYVPPAKTWGVCARLAGTGSDAVMLEDGEYLVARDLEFLDYSFRLRVNNVWKDATDLGLAEPGQVEIHQGIQLISTKANKQAGRSDSAPVVFEGSEGMKYDIYFSEETQTVWIMTAGCRPGDSIPRVTSILAKWKIEVGAAYESTFGTTAGIKDKAAGDGGLYVDANDGGSGRLTYVQIDKTAKDPSSVCKRMIASDGTPCVYGTMAGDHWLFTAQGAVKAGSDIHVSFDMRVQSKGSAYWRMEYFNGSDWVPVRTGTTTTQGAETFEYHYFMKTGALEPVNETFTVPATLDGVQIRFICAANLTTANASFDTAPNKNIRIGGAPIIEVTR